MPNKTVRPSEIEVGSRILWKERYAGERTGVVEHDSQYRDGKRVGGRSLANIYDECEWLQVLA